MKIKGKRSGSPPGRFKASFKSKVALETARERETLAELGKKYQPGGGRFTPTRFHNGSSIC